MCLILTFIAAIITTIIYFQSPKMAKKFSLEYLALMYLGASLMWSVDGFYRLIEGESFFELTLNDTLLGVVIIFCGLAFVGMRTVILKKVSK